MSSSVNPISLRLCTAWVSTHRDLTLLRLEVVELLFLLVVGGEGLLGRDLLILGGDGTTGMSLVLFLTNQSVACATSILFSCSACITRALEYPMLVSVWTARLSTYNTVRYFAASIVQSTTDTGHYPGFYLNKPKGH